MQTRGAGRDGLPGPDNSKSVAFWPDVPWSLQRADGVGTTHPPSGSIVSKRSRGLFGWRYSFLQLAVKTFSVKLNAASMFFSNGLSADAVQEQTCSKGLTRFSLH